MAVRIEYTGIDGKTTRFGATSPADAMTRLRGIKGYNGGVVDAAAAMLADGYAKRIGKNALHVASLRDNIAQTRVANPIGGGVASNGGQAARVKTLAGVHVDNNGNLIAEERDDYVTQGGTIAQVGPSIERNIGKVGAESKNEAPTDGFIYVTGTDGVTVRGNSLVIKNGEDTNLIAHATNSGDKIALKIDVYWK